MGFLCRNCETLVDSNGRIVRDAWERAQKSKTEACVVLWLVLPGVEVNIKYIRRCTRHVRLCWHFMSPQNTMERFLAPTTRHLSTSWYPDILTSCLVLKGLRNAHVSLIDEGDLRTLPVFSFSKRWSIMKTSNLLKTCHFWAEQVLRYFEICKLEQREDFFKIF